MPGLGRYYRPRMSKDTSNDKVASVGWKLVTDKRMPARCCLKEVAK